MKSAWSHINPRLKKVLKKQRATFDQVNYHLPDGYQEHVHCHVDCGLLKIYAENSAWASKLRYQQHQILKSIKSDPALNVQKIEIVVARDQPRIEKPDRKTPSLDASSTASALKVAESCDDLDIKAAFEKLAKTAARKPSQKN